MSPKKQRALNALIIAFGISVTIWFFVDHSGPSFPRRDSTGPHLKESKPLIPSPAAITASSNGDPWKGGSTFSASVSDCSPTFSQARDSEDLLKQLEASGELSREVSLENWHLHRPDGAEERIMLLSSDRLDAQGKKEVRWFTVDEEGLPVPQKIPKDQAIDPTADFLDQLKNRGEIFFHQVQEQRHFKNQISANVEWVNGHTHELQVFFPGKTLSCRDQSCQCR